MHSLMTSQEALGREVFVTSITLEPLSAVHLRDMALQQAVVEKPLPTLVTLFGQVAVKVEEVRPGFSLGGLLYDLLALCALSTPHIHTFHGSRGLRDATKVFVAHFLLLSVKSVDSAVATPMQKHAVVHAGYVVRVLLPCFELHGALDTPAVMVGPFTPCMTPEEIGVG